MEEEQNMGVAASQPGHSPEGGAKPSVPNAARILRELREATRFNSPNPHTPGYRSVGFVLPNEIAWPTDGTPYDILEFLLSLVPPVATTVADCSQEKAR